MTAADLAAVVEGHADAEAAAGDARSARGAGDHPEPHARRPAAPQQAHSRWRWADRGIRRCSITTSSPAASSISMSPWTCIGCRPSCCRYVELFARALLETGAGEEDFVALSQRIGRSTGGIGMRPFDSATCAARGRAPPVAPPRQGGAGEDRRAAGDPARCLAHARGSTIASVSVSWCSRRRPALEARLTQVGSGLRRSSTARQPE